MTWSSYQRLFSSIWIGCDFSAILFIYSFYIWKHFFGTILYTQFVWRSVCCFVYARRFDDLKKTQWQDEFIENTMLRLKNFFLRRTNFRSFFTLSVSVVLKCAEYKRNRPLLIENLMSWFRKCLSFITNVHLSVVVKWIHMHVMTIKPICVRKCLDILSQPG